MSINDDISKTFLKLLHEQRISNSGLSDDIEDEEEETRRQARGEKPRLSGRRSSSGNITNRGGNAGAEGEDPAPRPAVPAARPVVAAQPMSAPISRPIMTQPAPIDQQAVNPSGAYMPRTLGVDARQQMATMPAQPTLWQRIQNFISGTPTYASGYGNNPTLDAYSMNLQKQNAMAARGPMMGSGISMGNPVSMGTVPVATSPVATSPVATAPVARPAPVPTSTVRAGAEGEDPGGPRAIPAPAPATPAPAAPTGTSSRSSDRDRLRAMGQDLARQRGVTTTTTDGQGGRTSTTTARGTYIGGVLVDENGRAVNPAEQGKVDQANKLRQQMQQGSGGAAGGKGISAAAPISGRVGSKSAPTRSAPVKSTPPRSAPARSAPPKSSTQKTEFRRMSPRR